jgi:hypothetical protein
LDHEPVGANARLPFTSSPLTHSEVDRSVVEPFA